MEPMFEEALASVSLKFGADFQLKARQKDALKHIWAMSRDGAAIGE